MVGLVQISQMATRISYITGRRGFDDLAGKSGSVDVAVSLQGMVGAVMTMEQVTRSLIGVAVRGPRLDLRLVSWISESER